MLNAHQLQLVVTFANVAAIAMENARLFEQTREGLRTKEVLLREMHHRVKNNLQQVASILNMQRRRARLPEVEQILVESVDRIQGIAATHDLLSNTQLGMAPVDEIARKIVGIVRGNLVPPQLHVRFDIANAPYPVPSEQATTLAIILNELIANAIEHGFEGRKRGEIRIGAALADNQIVVRVADDGAGLPEGFSMQTTEGLGLGLQLVSSLVRSDLHGAVDIFRTTGSPQSVQSASVDEREDTAEHVGSSPEEQAWTVAEVRLPVVLTKADDGL
jgi:two-component sensor histidine kinase